MLRGQGCPLQVYHPELQRDRKFIMGARVFLYFPPPLYPLWTACLCPWKFMCSSPNPQRGSIGSWGLWEVVGFRWVHVGVESPRWDWCPYKKKTLELALSPVRRSEGVAVCKEVASYHFLLALDLGLPSLQNCEKLSAVQATKSTVRWWQQRKPMKAHLSFTCPLGPQTLASFKPPPSTPVFPCSGPTVCFSLSPAGYAQKPRVGTRAPYHPLDGCVTT